MVSRGFCPNCGSPVYSLNAAMPDLVFPRGASLDDLEVIAPAMAVYTSRAASWDYVDPALPTFEKLPDGGPEQVIADHG